jgi:hypothetical protein
MTAECWIQIGSAPGGFPMIMGSNGRLQFQMNGNGQILFGFGNGGSFIVGATNCADGAWHHVSGVWHGSSGLFLYIDGVQDATQAALSIRALAAVRSRSPTMVQAAISGPARSTKSRRSTSRMLAASRRRLRPMSGMRRTFTRSITWTAISTPDEDEKIKSGIEQDGSQQGRHPGHGGEGPPVTDQALRQLPPADVDWPAIADGLIAAQFAGHNGSISSTRYRAGATLNDS